MLLQGNKSAALGAYRAGCRFFAGYPISPSSEIMEEAAALLQHEGVFVQMEDEIASISAVIGASLAGVKAMTATSGPGFSLMQECIGYAYFTETPIVIIDVQRAGPATGQATRTAQGDIMQMRFGSHGDVHPIALCPWSPQEMYELTVRAFNLSETLRVPVIVAADESIAHAREPVTISDSIDIFNRDRSTNSPPFGTEDPVGIPPLPAFGQGAKLLVTGSTHDERGIRRVDDPICHENLVSRLMNKILFRENEIVETESMFLDDAEVAFFAFGISARSAAAAVCILRAHGFKVGLLRTRTIWPFPKKAISNVPICIRAFIVPELNTGMSAELLKCCTDIPVHSFTQTDGNPILPSRLVEFAGTLL